MVNIILKYEAKTLIRSSFGRCIGQPVNLFLTAPLRPRAKHTYFCGGALASRFFGGTGARTAGTSS